MDIINTDTKIKTILSTLGLMAKPGSQIDCFFVARKEISWTTALH